MSPEQARGQTVDARSDIFAFGIMLLRDADRPSTLWRATRQRCAVVDHQGCSAPRSPRCAPGFLASSRRLVRRCLAKDPARRLQSALDSQRDGRAPAGDRLGRVAPRRAARPRRVGTEPSVLADGGRRRGSRGGRHRIARDLAVSGTPAIAGRHLRADRRAELRDTRSSFCRGAERPNRGVQGQPRRWKRSLPTRLGPSRSGADRGLGKRKRRVLLSRRPTARL